MNEKIIKELKETLKKKKENLEEELAVFARKNKKVKGDWKTSFPHFNGGTGGQRLEESADEVEEFINLLPIESNLELQLQDVNLALEKIKKGKYGKCEKCKKTISLDRLKAFPEAKTCESCK
jgi:DnaK suppressor protein